MAHAYTPGLKVLENTSIEKERRLPLKGEVLVDKGEDNYTVKNIKNKKNLEECKSIGEAAIKAIPKIKIGNTEIKPALVRTDFTCCLENKKHIPTNYFLNEIEHQDAGSYVNFDNINYPYVQIMADTYVKKAHELINAGF